MGLFSRRPVEPVEHPPVERIVFVRATEAPVVRQLEAYGELFPARRSVDHTLELAASGEWSAIRLPDAVHPWQLHNLAFWMLDCEGAGGHAIAWSGASPHHPGYRLVQDPEMLDALCGWDDAGNGWTVYVPTNDVVRPETVPVPRALSYPSGFSTWRPVTVRLEDPGHEMNPTNAPTKPSRTSLGDTFDVFSWAP